MDLNGTIYQQVSMNLGGMRVQERLAMANKIAWETKAY